MEVRSNWTGEQPLDGVSFRVPPILRICIHPVREASSWVWMTWRVVCGHPESLGMRRNVGGKNVGPLVNKFKRFHSSNMVFSFDNIEKASYVINLHFEKTPIIYSSAQKDTKLYIFMHIFFMRCHSQLKFLSFIHRISTTSTSKYRAICSTFSM